MAAITTRKLYIYVIFALLLAGLTYFILSNRTRIALRVGVDPYGTFSWPSYLSAHPRDAGAADWARIAMQGPNRAYRELANSIRQNTITIDAGVAFEVVTDDPMSRKRFTAFLNLLDGANHLQAVKGLYQTLMLAPPNKEILLARLKSQSNRALRQAGQTPEDGGRFIGWALSTATYAALIAYERTKDVRFVDLAAASLLGALQMRDDKTGRTDQVRGRVMPGWGGKYGPNGEYMTNFTLAGRVGFVFALYADIVQRHPDLATRKSTAFLFLSAAQQTMDAYAPDFRTDGERGYYVRPAHGDTEPMNHMAWAGNALILLHKLTGDDDNRDKSVRIARFLKSHMTFTNGLVWWPYQVLPDGTGSPAYVWKASLTAQFILAAYSAGVVFTKEDVRAVAETVLQNVFRDDGRVSALIDGKFINMTHFTDHYGGYVSLTPFILYECVNPDVRTKMENLIASRPDVGGWLAGRVGLIAYAHRLEPRHPC